jgi:hypothetical protein
MAPTRDIGIPAAAQSVLQHCAFVQWPLDKEANGATQLFESAQLGVFSAALSQLDETHDTRKERTGGQEGRQERQLLPRLALDPAGLLIKPGGTS